MSLKDKEIGSNLEEQITHASCSLELSKLFKTNVPF